MTSQFKFKFESVAVGNGKEQKKDLERNLEIGINSNSKGLKKDRIDKISEFEINVNKHRPCLHGYRPKRQIGDVTNGAAMARDAPTVLLLERHRADDLFTIKPSNSPLSNYGNKAFDNSFSY